ncbi:polysaccharide biosynthesis/export family protein [Novosphingobium sp.]|uniref:polysaccharide biosynthesis/export family protein n=1 Tax=Novosphingobium sp. TaxID=1874826 RepID=UPI0033415336
MPLLPRPPLTCPARPLRTFALLTLALTSGCATMPTPGNLAGAQYQPAQRVPDATVADRCTTPALPAALGPLVVEPAEALAAFPDILGPGDRLRIDVSGDKDVLSHDYVITANGSLIINGIAAIPATGRTSAAVAQDLRDRLVAAGLIRPIANNLRLVTTERTGVAVSVEGAVFEPGVIVAGDRPNDARATTVANAALGDFNNGRSLATAIRAAGGLRPDAALDAVYLVRGDRYARIDLSPVLGGVMGSDGTGGLPVDPQLARGDRIIIPSAGCFQPRLVRPSPVTAPGIRVYMSNLSRPAASNASSAIGRDSTSLPYGTRFLQGLIAANCVGGSAMNAARSAVLISRNPVNGRSVVIARKVEALVRDSDRDEVDPYLMPGDAIACYDSTAMTIVDAVGVVGNLLGPAVLVKSLKP